MSNMLFSPLQVVLICHLAFWDDYWSIPEWSEWIANKANEWWIFSWCHNVFKSFWLCLSVITTIQTIWPDHIYYQHQPYCDAKNPIKPSGLIQQLRFYQQGKPLLLAVVLWWEYHKTAGMGSKHVMWWVWAGMNVWLCMWDNILTLLWYKFSLDLR